ncbi:hypothetical protein [Nocardia sp. Marseille-Q1738]
MGNYVPKPKSALDEQTFAFKLGEYEKWRIDLVVRYATYRGQIRDFSMSVWARAGDDRFEVESIDCCHGQLHRHRLRRSDHLNRQADRAVICELNAGDEAVVDREYDLQYDWIQANWESVARRWANG